GTVFPARLNQPSTELVIDKNADRVCRVKTRSLIGPNSFSRFVVLPVLAWLFGCLLIAIQSVVGAEDKSGVGLKLVAQGLTAPIAAVSLADGSGRLLIIDQIGTVHVLNKDGALSEKFFFDVRDRLTELKKGFDERGLLCLALHPRFRENG